MAETNKSPLPAAHADASEQRSEEKPPHSAEADSEHKPSPEHGAEPGETNGEVVADKATGNGDVEMAGNAGDDDQGTKSDVNGTSAAEKKAKRKSIGVPEHRTKKTLKHKKSVKEFHTDAQPGELYLAKFKGHPPWPSLIASDDMLPEWVAKKRPVTAMESDGTWKRPEYAPDGKRHNERTFAVMFLSTYEFAWLPNSDLTSITPDECKDVSEKSKSKGLIAAYAEAAQGLGLDHYKNLLNDHAAALAEEEAAKAERDAEKARKAEKKAKRKSGVPVDADEMDVDDEDNGKKPKGKKRKKEAGDADEEDKPAKTPKTSKATKLKLSTPKTPATGEKSAKKKEAKSTGKKKSTAKATDSDDADGPVQEKELSPEEKYAKREQEVKYCRHKLQRGLLTRDNIPSDDEVKTMSTYLKKLEDYPELEAGIIRATKIHKVLKAMLKLADIPRDGEFHFKQRSTDLLAKWNRVLDSHPAADDEKAGEDSKKDSSVPNGQAKADGKEAGSKVVLEARSKEKSDKTAEKTDSTLEEKSKDSAQSATASKDSKIGTDVEGDKEAGVADSSAPPQTSVKTDEPDISNAPADEYKPPVEANDAASS